MKRKIFSGLMIVGLMVVAGQFVRAHACGCNKKPDTTTPAPAPAPAPDKSE